MHYSDFVFIISTIYKEKMALGTSVEAAIETYTSKVGLGSPCNIQDGAICGII